VHSGIVDVLVCVCYCCQILRRFTETLVIKIMSVLIDYLGVFCKCPRFGLFVRWFYYFRFV